jgi:endonuclease/exonuclease/phosphatase family metal-dependent hydrolase
MSFARVAGALAVLVALSACSDGGTNSSAGPRLPQVELPATTQGQPYEQSLGAVGGVPPLRYAVSEPPPGFSFFNGTARLVGPGTVAGEYALTVEVKDAQGAQDTRTYALRVRPLPEVDTEALPVGASGAAYAHTLAASGGQPPLSWEVVNGSLPMGLSLSADGTLSGTPWGRGNYPFTVRVRDANGAQAQRGLTLTLTASSSGDAGAPDAGTPDAGTPFPLQVGNWNIEWFGDSTAGNGPPDEELQLANVHAVMADAGVDFWALQEVVNTAKFNQLKEGLSGYDGFLADDSQRVASGASYYSAGEQKLGVLFKSSLVRVQRAEVILTARNADFAGRPPLRVDLRLTRDGTTVDVVAILLHLKAFADTDAYAQRQRTSLALKEYIDTQLPNARVLVLGDWNDDVDTSITSGMASPFQNFLTVPTDYTFLTEPLSLQGVGSTVGRSSFIDHQLVSGELKSSHVRNSTRVLRPAISDYGATTSDHYPILSRFDFGQVTPSAQAPGNGTDF